MGTAYWYLYLTGEAGVKIQFDLGGPASAVEGGAGPLKLEGRDPEELDGLRRQLGISGMCKHERSTLDCSCCEGGTIELTVYTGETGKKDNDLGRGRSQGGTSSPGMGGWLTDLRDDGPYARTWKEREEMQQSSSRESDEKTVTGDQSV